MYTGINLCCGAGGMALGFDQAGIRVKLGIDIDPMAVRSFSLWPAKCDDVSRVYTIPPANIVFASVPGAGYSLLNANARGKNEVDPRNSLIYHAVTLALTSEPDAIVIDGVERMLQTESYHAARSLLDGMGFNTAEAILDAVDFGVPQRRKHAVFIALRRGRPFFPQSSHPKARMTVRDAIGDLPPNVSEQDFAFARTPTPVSLERYKVVGPGENWRTLVQRRPDLAPPCWLRRGNSGTDVFGRMEWDKPSLKIRTEFYKPEKGCYLHPSAHRPITHREAARLQTFPDWYRFVGNQTVTGRLIGNAVPPRFAKALAESVVKSLMEHSVHGKG